MQAKPERQTPINAGAYDSYNVMMKYILKIQKIPKRLHKSNHNNSSTGRRTHWYAELAVSSPAVAETVDSTHCTYTHGGMARLSGPGLPGKDRDGTPVKCGHQSQYYPGSTEFCFVNVTNTVIIMQKQPAKSKGKGIHAYIHTYIHSYIPSYLLTCLLR